MFKHDFKYYKSKQPPPDLSEVLDFNSSKLLQEKVRPVTCCLRKHLYGLKLTEHWEAYELVDNPGLIFIRNPFANYGQRYWIMRCLRDYTRRPNKLNLDVHGLVPDNQNWWETCQNGQNKQLLDKLRWATLGYHHNWDTKVYSDDFKSQFPTDLALLSEFFAAALGYDCFKAEAAIVNYYHMDSTLSGHTDHSEEYLEAPLFSFSFGQSAIFLLGGTTLEEKPTAMFLHSGDVVVMSKESRLCYHGVPRIISAPTSPWSYCDSLEQSAVDNHFDIDTVACSKDGQCWEVFNKYLNYSRININVRQVAKKSF